MKGLVVSTLSSSLIASVFFGTQAPNSKPLAIVYPIQQTTISSDYGMRNHPINRQVKHHSGVDLPAKEGTEIRAITDGIVIFAGKFGNYGNLLSIKHKNGITSHYGHCKNIYVKTGEQVRAGEFIAEVGQTGLVTGPHLHLELRLLGAPMDPKTILTALR